MSPETLLPILIILWSIQTIKSALFWLYLWQLKEYHLKRFIDHFRTEKGKKILLNPLRIGKITLLLPALFLPIFWPLLAVYALETIYTLLRIKGFRRPVFTAKIALLAGLAVFIIPITTFYLNLWLNGRTLLTLLLTDLLIPVIISVIVLLLQPLTYLLRCRIIGRAKSKRADLKDLIAIGITGSYGKTSTKEILKIVLADKFNVLATSEHQNSEIAIARCILNNLKPEHQIFICEMGAYDKGKIKEVAGIIQPQIGVVTGVNEQHLALFGNLENLLSAEGGIELAESLPDNGILILNEDNALIQKSKIKYQNENPKIKIEICSTKEKTDIWTENIRVEKDMLFFTVCDKTGDSADFKVNLVGEHNIENILLAAAVAKELGMSLPKIAAACKKIAPRQGTMRLVLGLASHKADIIDSTYSANPDGVLTALEHLKLWPGKKVIIMPCLIELGPAAKEVHQKIGGKIGEVCDFATIVTKEWFEEIKRSAIKTGMKPENIIYSENPQEIFEKLKPFFQPENVILLEGRGPIKPSDFV